MLLLRRCRGLASLAPTVRLLHHRRQGDCQKPTSPEWTACVAATVLGSVVGGCAAFGLVDGGWLEERFGRCRNAEPPPVALSLERFGEQPIEWQFCLGLYRLEQRKVNGQPCWRHIEEPRLSLSRAPYGNGWFCQLHDELGRSRGILRLRENKSSPAGSCAAQWEQDLGGEVGWVPADVHCVSLDEGEFGAAKERASHERESARRLAPAGLRLEGACKQTLALGVYEKSSQRTVCGRAAWQHTERPTLWLAYTGLGSWNVQTEDVLGQPKGLLLLRDARCADPSESWRAWREPQGSTKSKEIAGILRISASKSRWEEVPDTRCVELAAQELAMVKAEQAAATARTTARAKRALKLASLEPRT